MKHLLIALLSLMSLGLSAQTNATTENGKEVILYNNGTWVFANANKTKDELKAPVVKLNANLNAELATKELFYVISPKLEKYFGEKGKIKGSTKLIAVNGRVKIQFQFEFTLSDANRYYGKMVSGTALNLYSWNDKKIALKLDDNLNFSAMDKYHFSYYTASAWLTTEQVQELMTTPIEYAEVAWKKGSEKYQIKNKRIFMSEMKKLNDK